MRALLQIVIGPWSHSGSLDNKTVNGQGLKNMASNQSLKGT